MLLSGTPRETPTTWRVGYAPILQQEGMGAVLITSVADRVYLAPLKHLARSSTKTLAITNRLTAPSLETPITRCSAIRAGSVNGFTDT